MKQAHHMSDAEHELMTIVWQKNRCLSSADIQSALPDSTRWKATTILTFLSRLADKGMLRVEKYGKLNFYTPLISESTYHKEETLCFLQEHYGGSVSLLLSTLREAGGLEDEELVRAHELLSHWRLERD